MLNYKQFAVFLMATSYYDAAQR